MFPDRASVFCAFITVLIAGLIYAADASDLLVTEKKISIEELNAGMSRIRKVSEHDGHVGPEATWDFVDTHRQEVKDLRVFGYNKNSLRRDYFETQVSRASHLLISAPRREVNAIYQKKLCETDAMGLSEMLFIIPASNLIERKLDRATSSWFHPSRRCARLTGRTLNLVNFSSGFTNDRSADYQFNFGNMRADYKKQFLLTDFEEIDCL